MKILYIEWQKLCTPNQFPESLHIDKSRWTPVKVVQIVSNCRTVEKAVKDALRKFKAAFKPGTYNISMHINDTAIETGIINENNLTLTGTGFTKIIDHKG